MATSAFGKAFRAARDAGDKEFEFGGKKYNTKLKEETSAPAPVNTSRYVSPDTRDTYKAQERANQGLNEDASGFLDSDKGRKTYEESGKGTVDRQNAAKAKPQELPKPMPIADFLKQQGQSMKHGGSVKKMAGGGRSWDGSEGRGMTQTPGDKKLNSPGRWATKILPSSRPPLTRSSSNDISDDSDKTMSAKKGGMIKKMASGGSASSRGDGIAQRGKTRGKMC